MKRSHINRKTAEALVRFMWMSCPEPIEMLLWVEGKRMGPFAPPFRVKRPSGLYPAYKLHDLLSMEFCGKFHQALWRDKITCCDDVGEAIYRAYQKGGITAVERKLLKIIGAK